MRFAITAPGILRFENKDSTLPARSPAIVSLRGAAPTLH
jgi:hypothetical protein